MKGIYRCWTEIDRRALRHNAIIVRERAGSTEVLAVVKANAYGHGLMGVAEALAGEAQLFGVANLEEALALPTPADAEVVWERLRARALNAAGQMVREQGDNKGALALFEDERLAQITVYLPEPRFADLKRLLVARLGQGTDWSVVARAGMAGTFDDDILLWSEQQAKVIRRLGRARPIFPTSWTSRTWPGRSKAWDARNWQGSKAE